METIEIKSKLQKLIDEQDDMKILQEIYTFLQETTINPRLRLKLSERAKKSEADIIAGRTFTKEEILQRTNHN